MFGIGFGEMILIAVVLLIAVGPNRMPTLLKSVVRAYRQFRNATRDLRASSGIDDILRDEDLRGLRKPLSLAGPVTKPKAKPVGKPPAREPGLTLEELEREDPPEGVDLAEIQYFDEMPSKDEQERIIAAKEAALGDEERIIRAKEIAAGLRPPEDAMFPESEPDEGDETPPDEREGV